MVLGDASQLLTLSEPQVLCCRVESLLLLDLEIGMLGSPPTQLLAWRGAQ